MSTRARSDGRQLAFLFDASTGPFGAVVDDERGLGAGASGAPKIDIGTSPSSGFERGGPHVRGPLIEATQTGDGRVLPFTGKNMDARRHSGDAARPKIKRLEDAIVSAFGRGTRVQITDNKTTLISRTKRNGLFTVRIHQMFLDGDQALFDDIARWLSGGDAPSARRVDQFIASKEHLLHHHARPLDDDAGRGDVHDLVAVMARMNDEYFDPPVAADITWGQKPRRGRRTSITLGTYDERARRITIHPALDKREVPEVCVARVVHHEMVHARHPPTRGIDGRRVVHGDVFRRKEAEFKEAREADRWLDDNLDHLLGQKRRGGTWRDQDEGETQ